jgi:DNA damage-binding protein 1
MTLEIYEGIVTVIPILREEPPKSRRLGASLPPAERPLIGLGEPLPARIEDMSVRSTAFLDRERDDPSLPRMAILYEDSMGEVKLKVRKLDYTSSTVTGDGGPSAELAEVDVLRDTLDLGSSMLIPVPNPLGMVLPVRPAAVMFVVFFLLTKRRGLWC